MLNVFKTFIISFFYCLVCSIELERCIKNLFSLQPFVHKKAIKNSTLPSFRNASEMPLG